ncbi:mitogen-activated protein kinase [Thraustotheca clavata]|uniref:Mitogen-activated protein kinase n=1 Tax=Thraustotheca clavata TaxID=74557 RepID=A0A1V9ZIK1_9STRA|nr:mitogen-activated protein kinase [Thraustotheca clavata]
MTDEPKRKLRTQSDCYTSGERERAWRHSLFEELGMDVDNLRSDHGRLSLGASLAKMGIGNISERANEVLMDACVSKGGKESKLYHQALSVAENGRISVSTANVQANLDENEIQSMLDDAKEAVEMGDTPVIDDLQPATLEPIEWEGFLSKRSEWLRRWEKQYYVLSATTLKRFASKEAYMTTLQSSPVEGQTAPIPSSYTTYVVSGVKEAPTRTNGFVFTTADGKSLQLTAPSAIERVIWMRLAQEAMVSLPDLPVFPLEIEEFYAMLIVLYTAYSGNWRTTGDMAVTLPPPSEQVFTRFFRLIDKDVLVSSNYPPSVPFCGNYRGISGLLQYINTFAANTLWYHFKIEGIAMEDSVAVASGKEELENAKDRRKFVQNWVHKFNFSPDGRLMKFEINGDVVAASAVFKVPGAATTLSLPQDLHEVPVPTSGTLTVRVLQGSGIKSHITASGKKSSNGIGLKDPRVVLKLLTSDEPPPPPPSHTISASSYLPSIPSMPSLPIPVQLPSLPATISRRLSSASSMMYRPSLSATTSSSSSANSTPMNTDRKSDSNQMTDVARNRGMSNSDCVAPVWNTVIDLTFENIQGPCRLHIDVIDMAKGEKAIASSATVNVARYIVEQSSGQTQWVTMSNGKGEFCGRVQISVSCSVDKKEPGTNTPVHLMQWHTKKNAEEIGRPGWSNVNVDADTKSGSSDSGSPESTFAIDPLKAKDCDDDPNMHVFTVCSAPFVIPKHYNLIKVCGRGAYGIVIAATNNDTGGSVAIKKVIDCIWHPHQLKQILREVRLMRHLCHENILSLMDLIPPPSYQDFRDVYMTVDLMEMDLHRIIYSKEVLSDDHIRYFVYQMLSGLEHMHACGVLHRDLKPSNLLINSDCQLKICDMGLARPKDVDDLGMTEYVVTRWYRAPELLLGSTYDEGVDVWAAGCIMAEMLGRKPLFPGRSYVHQLQLIMNVLGVPEEHSFKENPQAQKFKGRQLLSKTPSMQGIDVSVLFPNANPEALDLLWKLLVFDSSKRLTVREALQHPYLAQYYDASRDETRNVEKFESFDFEDLGETELKELMFREICHFHPEEMEKRAKQMVDMPKEEKLPPGWVKRESRSIRGKFYYSHAKRGISTWVKPIV